MKHQYGQFIVAMGFALLAGSGALAQSAYGCTNLAGRHNMPAIEGSEGVFYRIDPELHMFHSISDESTDQLAKFSTALADTGTTLIYAPVPTRALAMPDQLPHRALEYGFKAELAATVYDDTIRRLTDAQVLSANLRKALRISTNEPLPFFATDPRLTPNGAQRMALAIAEVISQTDGFSGVPKAQFATTTGATVDWPSNMRAKLQRHCMLKIPPVRAPEYATNLTQAATTGSNGAIFGSRAQGLTIALVGTDVTGSGVSNLAGFLSEATGLAVVEYSVADGGSYAAISSFLTSTAFQETRPAFLVWANPISNNLARYGDQPMRELTAAATGGCRISLPFARGNDAKSVWAELYDLDPRQSYTLYVDADGAAASEARFDFKSRDGLVQSKYVVRHPSQVKTGRFYMPLSGLWQEGAQSIDIVLDVPFGPNTRVSACLD